ncbi:hypothetical protein HBIAX_02562 [Achromobacter xylosoxidans]|nr:hypothetical protein HBIAX_02562 [Achromobacter xylosoxidans]
MGRPDPARGAAVPAPPRIQEPGAPFQGRDNREAGARPVICTGAASITWPD